MIDDQTKEGRQKVLESMRQAVTVFYSRAIYSGCHALIEFTGLMNEYINVCAQAEKQDIDWLHANVHGEVHLPFAPQHIAYLNEKLECIYGLQLSTPIAPAKKTARRKRSSNKATKRIGGRRRNVEVHDMDRQPAA